jgi:CMP-N,N'-diacetyllegionaminic acid synthase
MNDSFLAIIPARKGSKRLPNKNILPLGHKPLINWTIEAAINSHLFETVIVSTDSEEIAEIANKAGAEIPFIRPLHLANDAASSIDVVIHAINHYKTQGKNFDYIVLLQPTSPLRTSTDITDAIKVLEEKEANSVISVCEMDHSPLWSNTLPSDNSLKNFLKPEIQGKRSQDLKTYYRLNGAIYICKTEALLMDQSFITKDKSYGFIMDKNKSVDIDSELDFKFAEFLVNYINKPPYSNGQIPKI